MSRPRFKSIVTLLLTTFVGSAILSSPGARAASRNAYEVLEVDRYADDVTIKRKFRALAMKWHPDRGGNEAKFKEINEAYEKIKTAQARSAYEYEHGFVSGSDFNSNSNSASNYGSAYNYGSTYSAGINARDLQAFRDNLGMRAIGALAVSLADPLSTFLNLFYTDKGSYIDATSTLTVVTGRRQIAGAQLEQVYRDLFYRFAQRIWFVAQSTEDLRNFECDFAGYPLPTAIVRHMMTMYDRTEFRRMTAMFTFNIADSENYAEQSVLELLRALPLICKANAPACVTDLAFEMEARTPKIYKILNRSSALTFIQLMDSAMAAQPKFTRDYFRLLHIRNQISRLHQNFVAHSLDCAFLLTGHLIKHITNRPLQTPKPD